jgi:hypothetical protein
MILNYLSSHQAEVPLKDITTDFPDETSVAYNYDGFGRRRIPIRMQIGTSKDGSTPAVSDASLCEKKWARCC